MLRRRDFLKQTAAAGIALAGGALTGSCSGLTRSKIADGAPTGRQFPRLDPTDRSILYHASLAPSGHNSQPWRVRIESLDKWGVEADAERRLPAVDPDNRELLLSIGAFVENLSLAAGAMGRETDIQILASGRHDRDVVRIVFEKTRSTGYPLEKIRLRRTVKHGFSAAELSCTAVDSFSRLAGGRLFYFPRGSSHAQCMRDAAVESFRIQAGRDDAQRELVGWLRLSDRAARQYRDGLTTEGMEIRGLKGWYLRHLAAPADFLAPSFRRKSVDITARLAAEGGGWMVITSPGNTVADLIETGRRFQRIALAARKHGVGIQPMTQVLEEKSGRDAIAGNHEHSFCPQFVLRVGYVGNYPAPVSLRRPVEWFTTA